MKGIFLCIAALSAVLFVSCATTDKPKPNDPGKPDIVEQGWVSDNAFRVKTFGETEFSSADKESVQKSSEAAAVKKAREAVVKNFVTVRMKQTPGAGNYAVLALAIDKEFRDIIEGGKIITKSFDNNDKKCIIVYQVENNGLKKMVEQGSQKK